MTTTALAAGAQRAPVAGALRPSRPATRKIAHLLAADLRRQILGGELAVDQQLPPEAELTTAFQVSRETLREALRILESQSLLEIRRGRGGGAVVRRPGISSVGRYVALLLQLRGTTVAHLEEARTVIEPPAAEHLAVNCSQKRLDYLVSLHDNERAAEGDPLSFTTAVAFFDQAVTALSGNRSIAVIAGILRDIYAGQVYTAVGASDSALAERVARRVAAGHSEFLQAVQRRDGAAAHRAWTSYLSTTSRMLVTRSRSRQPLDVVPLWRAQISHAGTGEPRRMATAVATEIRARIAEGRLGDGDRLPPLADLAREFGVSRPTLREALRILETESLLELRTGDRGGARVHHPSTQVAAQLTGTVLAARQTTLADFHQAVCMIEPAMMGLAATRMDPASLAELESLAAELAASAEDFPRFAEIRRRGVLTAFAATRNPALGVIAEILQWVRAGIQQALTPPPEDPAIRVANHIIPLFAELVAAFADADSARARQVWAACLEGSAPFLTARALGPRMMIDLIDLID